MGKRTNARALWAGARWAICVSAAVVMLAAATDGRAGQKKKKPATDASSDESQAPQIQGSTFDEIDRDIGEMLGTFQVGDVEAMHKYYSDSVTFVREAYEPPLVGWQNYVAEYQRERAAFEGMQVIRRNTTIFVHNDVAWASYQWEFAGTLLSGKPYMARGQTTLVLTKVNGAWVIVHNHTSELCPMATAPAAAGKPAVQQAPPVEETAPQSPQPKP